MTLPLPWTPMLSWPAIALGAAALALFLAALGWPVMPSYLSAWLTLAALPIGTLPILMMLELLGGRWGQGAAAPLRATLRPYPLVAILFLPVLANPGALYPWAGAGGFPPGHAADLGWLQPLPFALRSLLYLAVFGAFALVFAGPARRPEELPRRQRLAAAGLALHGFVSTFAAFDWMMSLEPDWRSSGYGLMVAELQATMALALACALGGGRDQDPKVRGDLGTLLFIAVTLWAYLAFMQFLVIWSGNLPVEVVWYLRRGSGFWSTIAVLVVIGLFVVPFLALTAPALRRRKGLVPAMGWLVIGCSALHMAWLVLPAFRREGMALVPADLLCLLAFAAGAVAWLQRRHQPALPRPVPAHG